MARQTALSLLVLYVLAGTGVAQESVTVHVFTRHAGLLDSDQSARDIALKGVKTGLGPSKERKASRSKTPVRLVTDPDHALVRVEILSVSAAADPLTGSRARMYVRAVLVARRTKTELTAVTRSYIQPEHDVGAYEAGVRIANLVRDWIEKNRKLLVGEFIEMPQPE